MARTEIEGTVLSIVNEKAVVRIRPREPCPQSHAGCPARALAEGGEFVVEATNSIHAAPGDRVVVEVESPHYYKALLLAFGLPLIGMGSGYAAGSAVGRAVGVAGEGVGALGALLGFCSSFAVMPIAGRISVPRYTITGWSNRQV